MELWRTNAWFPFLKENKNLKDKCEKMEQSIQSLKLQYEGALNEIDGLTKMNQMILV